MALAEPGVVIDSDPKSVETAEVSLDVSLSRIPVLSKHRLLLLYSH